MSCSNMVEDSTVPGYLMTELSLASKEWYVSSNCPFIRAALLDIVSIFGYALLGRRDAAELLPAWIAVTRVFDLGPTFALTTSKQVADALLRKSLAQAYIIDRVILSDGTVGQLTNEKYQDIGETLTHLSTEDPDTCCAALFTLESVLKLEVDNGLTIPLDLILGHVHNALLSSTDAEVISIAQSVLANGLTRSSLRKGFFSVTTEDQILSTIPKLEAQCLNGPPSNMQSALHLLGFFLDFAYQKYPTQRRKIFTSVTHYIRILRMTIIDTNPFDMRFAAIQSLSALSSIWKTSTATGPLILGLGFVLYDLLNDDDDEIRDVAALTTGNLLRAQLDPQIQDTVPILTSHRLATWLPSAFVNSTDLRHEALRRLTNTPSPTPLFSISFEETFAVERKEDNALFATEKQNLYRDDTLDAVLWARVLISLTPPTSSMSTKLIPWVLDGLGVLTETAEQEGDGALGWASKSEVFTLGMRIILGAEVVLAWCKGGLESVKRMEVLVAMEKLVDVGRQREVHGLWILKAEKVLQKEVLGVLRRVKGNLCELES